MVGPPAAPPEGRSCLRGINASVGQNVRLITVEDIDYFQSNNKYSRVVTGDGEALIRNSRRELIDEPDPQQFWQIHRCTLVNAAAIAGASRDFRSRMQVRLKRRNETRRVSESFTHLFRQMCLAIRRGGTGRSDERGTRGVRARLFAASAQGRRL